VTTAAPVSDYGQLFRGAARIGLLAGALEVPWDKVADFVAAFSEQLNDYMETSACPLTGRMGLMTRCEGADATHRIARFMEVRGIDETALRRLLVRARHFEHKNLFFKIEVGPEGIAEFSYYFRRRPEIIVAHAWLSDSGVGVDGLALMDAVAEVLDKATVHFLGAALCPNGTFVDKVYFSQPEELKSWERIRAAAKLVGLDDRDFAPVAAHGGELAGRTSFVSLGFKDGAAVPGLKLDVHDVHPLIVEAVLDGADAGDEATDRARLPMDLCGHQHHSYVGFRLAPGLPCRVKTYATTTS
jgi:hypothetical protein